MTTPLLLQGTALALPLRDNSVHMICTSPPYWNLRDYGTATWEDGDPTCDHSQEAPRFNGPKQIRAQVSGHASKAESHRRVACHRCGATRVDAQIGLEETLEAYLAALVQVFREVWRVLRSDGTLWLNIGDSYNSARGGRPGNLPARTPIYHPGETVFRGAADGLKEKDLCMVPARLALALQADGWTLRSAITWCKVAPMPESVQDRPTRATEMIYLLTKQPTYFYNADAVRVYGGSGWHGSSFVSDYDEATKAGLGRQARQERPGHNLWDYWLLGPEPTANGHYASFPPALVERCVLAGSRPGDLVFDPFCGSGTVMLVARDLGRASVGLDLSWAYLRMAQERLGCTYDHLPLFQEVAP